MATPAIFLDRDGVLNENRSEHVRNWSEFRFLPGALSALRELTRLGLPLLVVTNQAIVNRNLATRETLEEIHRRMIIAARHEGAEIRSVLYCPHDPAERCHCRKPEPGLLLQASERFDVDLQRSVLVGDAWTDIEAGQRSGCKTVLVLTGRGRAALRYAWEHDALRPTAIVDDLLNAVPVIAALVGLRSVTGVTTRVSRVESPVPALFTGHSSYEIGLVREE